jgi:hypothetical protein
MTTADTNEEMYTPTPIRALEPDKPIDTVQNLADHLYVAGQVELSTIPLYLYAAYSIKTKGYSQWAPPQGALRTLIGVVIEEMLHLTLVRNLMIAIGHGNEMIFYKKEFIPRYPSLMLNRECPLELHLKGLSFKHVDTFIELESPDNVTLTAERAESSTQVGQYTSLGAFYRKIERGFESLDGQIAWTREGSEDFKKQYLRGFWNQFGAGKPIRVYNLKSAKDALKIIIEQGEGSAADHHKTPDRPDKPQPGYEEYTHYEKFVRIRKGIEGIGAGNAEIGYDFGIDSPCATWPVVDNPHVEDYHDCPSIYSLMNLSNAAYCYLLCVLDGLFQKPTTDVRRVTVPGTEREEFYSYRYGLERNCIAAMQGILYPVAELLTRTPIKDDWPVNAGPPFQYYEFHSGKSKKEQLAELCEEAMRYFPELGGTDSVRRQISLLVSVP